MMKIACNFISLIAIWSFRGPCRSKFCAFPINFEFEIKAKHFLNKFCKFANEGPGILMT